MNDEWTREISEARKGIVRRELRAGNGVPSPSRFTLAGLGPWPRVILKHWSWIVLMTVVVTAAATALAETQPRVYRAQAEVAVYPASSGSSALQPYVMGTEKGIAASGDVLSIASHSLLISQTTLQRGLSVTVPVDTDLLVISFTDPNPQMAQSVAQGVAQAYVAYRTWEASSATTGKTPPAPPVGALQPSVVSDATLPTSPVSPNRLLIVGAALILGLVLGIGLALIRDMIDDSLRGLQDLETQAESTVLAQIPAFQRKRRSPADRLIMVRNPASPVAEAYRNLRTRVLQVAARRRVNVLLVTSPGREDKTTVAANLAAALAQSGRRVVLVCADLRWGSTHALFGLPTRPGLAKVIDGDAALAHALRWTEVPRLQVLPGGPAPADPSSALQSPAFRTLLMELRSEADFVVIEAPPVLASADTPALAELGGMIVLVADARTSTRAEVQAASHELGHVRDGLIGCVLDNVGRPLRMLQPFKPSAMTDVDAARTWSQAGPRDESTLITALAANGGELNHEQQTTAIHGEV